MPKVSVISGYYNRGQFLERTINSILDQSFEDLELIVFDDCSTDNTSEEIERLRTKYEDDRLTFIIHHTNKGFVRGLIDAIDSSQGEYVAIQGSGDVSLPDRIQLQATYLDNHPEVGVVGGWLYNIQENSTRKSLHKPQPGHLSFSDLNRVDPPFTHGEVMFRRTAYEVAGKYRPVFKYAQDYDLWYRMSKVSDLAIIPTIIYHRYTLLDGVSFVPSKTVLQRSYALCAKRLSLMSVDQEKDAYLKIQNHGPLSIVPVLDPDVQSFVAKAVIRLNIAGNFDAAQAMAEDYIAKKTPRFITKIVLSLLSSRSTRSAVIWLLEKLQASKRLSRNARVSCRRVRQRIQS